MSDNTKLNGREVKEIYVYSEDGEFEGIYQGDVNSSIKNCLYGTKGYGWYEGKYYSKGPATIFSREQEKEYFDIWLSKNFKRIQDLYRNAREFDEDAIQEVVLYCYREIEKPRGINNYFNQFNWKLKKYLIDKARARKVRRKYIKEDIVKGDKEFIRDVAPSKFYNEDYDCVSDINNWIKGNVVADYVYTKFKEQGKMFIEYYNDKLDGKRGGVREIATRYGVSIGTAQASLAAIKKDIDANKEVIKEVYALSLYKNLDDYSLNEIINY